MPSILPKLDICPTIDLYFAERNNTIVSLCVNSSRYSTIFSVAKNQSNKFYKTKHGLKFYIMSVEWSKLYHSS